MERWNIIIPKSNLKCKFARETGKKKNPTNNPTLIAVLSLIVTSKARRVTSLPSGRPQPRLCCHTLTSPAKYVWPEIEWMREGKEAAKRSRCPLAWSLPDGHMATVWPSKVSSRMSRRHPRLVVWVRLACCGRLGGFWGCLHSRCLEAFWKAAGLFQQQWAQWDGLAPKQRFHCQGQLRGGTSHLVTPP